MLLRRAGDGFSLSVGHTGIGKAYVWALAQLRPPRAAITAGTTIRWGKRKVSLIFLYSSGKRWTERLQVYCAATEDVSTVES